MARRLQPKDCHVLINLIAKELTGQNASVTAIDSSTFVSVGESILSYGTENVFNAAAIVLGRYLATTRPYEAKIRLINAVNSGVYTTRFGKVSYYTRESHAAGNYNTDLFTNFSDGYDNGNNSGNSTASMWVQNQPKPVVMYFGGSSVWQDSTTIYDEAFKYAFQNEEQFAIFWEGAMGEKANDMETQKEAFNRAVLCNYIAGVYSLSASMPKSVRNLTAEYNTKYGTSYTTEQLQTTYLQSFLEFFVAEFKLASDYMTNRTANYHWTPDSNEVLLRHTPKSAQRVMLYNPLFTNAKASVFPEIFNPRYLDMSNYEGIDFWQNINEPSAIKCKPAIPDVSDPRQQTAGQEVSLGCVLGILFDKDAIMTDFVLDRADTTPLEARKHYRNIWWSYSRNAINDFTENGIIFIMQD